MARNWRAAEGVRNEIRDRTGGDPAMSPDQNRNPVAAASPHSGRPPTAVPTRPSAGERPMMPPRRAEIEEMRSRDKSHVHRPTIYSRPGPPDWTTNCAGSGYPQIHRSARNWSPTSRDHRGSRLAPLPEEQDWTTAGQHWTTAGQDWTTAGQDWTTAGQELTIPPAARVHLIPVPDRQSENSSTDRRWTTAGFPAPRQAELMVLPQGLWSPPEVRRASTAAPPRSSSCHCLQRAPPPAPDLVHGRGSSERYRPTIAPCAGHLRQQADWNCLDLPAS